MSDKSAAIHMSTNFKTSKNIKFCVMKLHEVLLTSKHDCTEKMAIIAAIWLTVFNFPKIFAETTRRLV